MAAQKKNVCGQNAVYGSLAYDFNNPALYPTTEYASPLEIPARPERTKAAPRTAAAAKPKYAVAPFAVLGLLVAALIFVAGIMAQIQLVDVTNSAVELNSEIEQLQREQVKLRIAYESAFNLAEIEDYAISSLGMQKASADQIVYIDTSAPDKAVALV